ncbi:hypothetical protein [Clostridium pasteurianum]|uniref:Lipoprotein n=1 Tax=Clostridium pasteurianum BC1 TaxID=86416 RepID=R4KA07_CLOPA|nr:hypothetical protein [Clostridium pasteurianum]AGK99413.1 hypothetical protein Clopa_4726 [Clostridium pasteurianum BC1]
MKVYWYKKVLLFLLTFVFIFGITACYDDKKIILSNDVKKDVTAQEKNTVKLEKIKELPMDNSEYDPLYWKDDENFIAINAIGNSSNNYNIYNVNINTSQTTKIATLNDAYITGKAYPGYADIRDTDKRLLFIRDFKLWIYDISNGTSKIIYDLSEVKGEIEEKYSHYSVERNYDKSGKPTSISTYPKKEGDKTLFKVEYSSDFHMGLAADFVGGSSKYVYLNSLSGLKILDLDTGKVVKLSAESSDNEAINKADSFGGNFQVVLYNKIKDTFYTSIYRARSTSVTEDKTDVYEFLLKEPNVFKKVIILQGYGFERAVISSDGKNIYFNNSRSTGAGETVKSIIKYDTIKNTYSKLFEDRQDGGGSPIRYNYKLGLIYYEYPNESTKTGNQRMYFLGTIKDGKLKVIENLVPEEITDMTPGFTNIIYNEKGDKFIFRVHFFGKDNSIKGKTYIYAVKNS